MNDVGKELIRLQIADTWGFNVETLKALLKVLDADPPEHFWFHSPSPVVAYFNPTKSDDLKKRVLPGVIRVLQKSRTVLEHSRVTVCLDRFKIDGALVTGNGAPDSLVYEQNEPAKG
jgi:hypothetical protein